jgi:transposase
MLGDHGPMHISTHHHDDLAELDRRLRIENNATQRDRLRAVRLSLDGLQEPVIRAMLGRSRDFVQKWCYAYRDGGLDAIATKPRPGRPTKLPREQEEALRQRILAGPTEADGGVCTLRGVDVVRILEQEFGVSYSLDGVYDLLERLGFSCLTPRPTHRKNDPTAMQHWVERAPFLSKRSRTGTPTNASKSGSRTKHASDSKAR